jgi:hypothetical protein
MAYQLKDYTGQEFGRLTALRFAKRQNGTTYWRFSCACGAEKDIAVSGVVGGAVRSCGCLHRERARSGLNQTRHGQARVGHVSRLHNIWRGILKRVDAKRGEAHQKYAARGIGVCPEWRQFEAFRDWAAETGYTDDLTIDRIDNDGDYKPSNCRWADAKAQCRNRRTTRYVTAFGQTQSLAAWAEAKGIPQSRLHARLRLGWSAEDALTRGVHQRS